MTDVPIEPVVTTLVIGAMTNPINRDTMIILGFQREDEQFEAALPIEIARDMGRTILQACDDLQQIVEKKWRAQDN